MSGGHQPQRQAPGLYIHLPFCSAICPYCDFAVTVGDGAARGRFVAALEREIGLWAGEWDGIDTVYLGGGTPSLVAPEDLERLLAAVRRSLVPGADLWVGLEANPEDADADRLAAWRALGVSMLSLGVQSFDDRALAFLGRRHDGRAARRAVAAALAAGFPTVSIDLIYALPGQQRDAWDRELAAALELAPDHVSCYELTFEPATPFGRRQARGALVAPAAERRAGLFFHAHRRLDEAGWSGYEVSSFARAPRHRSRHNAKYWTHAPYLGLGPSAHSYDGGRRRWWNERGLDGWAARLERGERPLAGAETLSAEELALEALMLGLRTRRGIDLAALARRTGWELVRERAGELDRLCERGLVALDGQRLVPLLAGMAAADSLAVALAPGGRAPARRPA